MTSSIDRQPAVRCLGVTKTYGTGPARVAALRGVDLEVRRGQLFMLAGPSGCGKTTLISIISAILDRDDGRCEVLGREVNSLDEEERVQFRGRRIGFVFQTFNLLPALSAVENVAVPLLIQGAARGTAMERARASLETVGLASRAGALPGEMSGGQQQRVAIARALIHQPELIVCDEPTSSLDHENGHDMMLLLRRMVHGGDRTIVVVTHDPRILEFGDTVARMDDGRVVGIDHRNDGEGSA